MSKTLPSKRKTPLLDFFPKIEPYSSGYMAVDAPHEIYWEQCGNPDGVPVVYFHGGPGAGFSENAPRFFDPDHYRIILFDQRGSGRSTPLACLENNTTAHLLQDIEQLRAHLKIKQWHIFGGSWGSTLALSYASQHADKCLSMALRGIFLMEQEDINWLYQYNQNIWPEAWEQFISLLDEQEQQDIIGSYYRRLKDGDDKTKMDTAINWSLYESACASLIPNYETISTEDQRDKALAISTIEAHYFATQIISPKDSLVKNVSKFRHVPATIVQGRYDTICPIANAYKLHNAWPEADYIVVPDAGHSAEEPSIRSRLIEATENYKTLK